MAMVCEHVTVPTFSVATIKRFCVFEKSLQIADTEMFFLRKQYKYIFSIVSIRKEFLA